MILPRSPLIDVRENKSRKLRGMQILIASCDQKTPLCGRERRRGGPHRWVAKQAIPSTGSRKETFQGVVERTPFMVGW